MLHYCHRLLPQIPLKPPQKLVRQEWSGLEDWTTQILQECKKVFHGLFPLTTWLTKQKVPKLVFQDSWTKLSIATSLRRSCNSFVSKKAFSILTWRDVHPTNRSQANRRSLLRPGLPHEASPRVQQGVPYVCTVRIQDCLQGTKPTKSKCRPIEPSPFSREPIARSWPRRAELNIEDGCVLWGNCIIIPAQGRPQVIADFHEAHAGISRMKGLACGCVWRPYMDIELENAVRSCFQS